MSDATELAAWSAPAVNLPEHADNAIHTDAGARAAGFPSALVAGVTVYAYMTHVPVAAWGPDWLRGGGAHVRFRSPIFDHDLVNYVPTAAGRNSGTVQAQVGGVMRSACTVARVGSPPERCTGVGEQLVPREAAVDGDLPLYRAAMWAAKTAPPAGPDSTRRTGKSAAFWIEMIPPPECIRKIRHDTPSSRNRSSRRPRYDAIKGLI